MFLPAVKSMGRGLFLSTATSSSLDCLSVATVSSIDDPSNKSRSYENTLF